MSPAKEEPKGNMDLRSVDMPRSRLPTNGLEAARDNGAALAAPVLGVEWWEMGMQEEEEEEDCAGGLPGVAN